MVLVVPALNVQLVPTVPVLNDQLVLVVPVLTGQMLVKVAVLVPVAAALSSCPTRTFRRLA